VVKADRDAIFFVLIRSKCPLCFANAGTAFPVGLSAAGLPIGMQAIGPYLEDRTPPRFAALVAREIGASCHQRATTNRKLDFEHRDRSVAVGVVRADLTRCPLPAHL